jgi:hypothetical protein
MHEHNVPGLREQIHNLTQGIEVPRTSEGLRRLIYLLNYRANPGEHPPSVVYHDAQVATFTQEALSREDETVQEQALRHWLYFWVIILSAGYQVTR